MRKVLGILLLASCFTAHAYDLLQDVRYTMGPEFQGMSKTQFSVGLASSFDSEARVPIAMQGQLSKYLEVGGKVLMETYEGKDWRGNIDVGAKFRFSSGSFIAFDGYFGINRDNGGALALTYGNRHNVAKNFYMDYEARAAIGDAVVYPDGLFKLAAGVKPTLRFGEPVTASIEINTSGTVDELDDDYRMDLIPRLDIRIGSITLRGEYNIAILLEDNNTRNVIGLYVLYGF